MKKILNKLSVGTLIFLAFAITGIGTVEVLHQKSLYRSWALEQELELHDSILEESDDDSPELIENKTKINSSLRSESRDEEIEDEGEQSSRHRDDDNGDDDEDEYEDDDDDDDNSSRNSTPSQTPIATTTSTTVFTMAQVAGHNSTASCYSVINDSVYNLTGWINNHPGGSSAIVSLCGTDGTTAFNSQHSGGARPLSELAGFKIGILVK